MNTQCTMDRAVRCVYWQQHITSRYKNNSYNIFFMFIFKTKLSQHIICDEKKT